MCTNNVVAEEWCVQPPQASTGGYTVNHIVPTTGDGADTGSGAGSKRLTNDDATSNERRYTCTRRRDLANQCLNQPLK